MKIFRPIYQIFLMISLGLFILCSNAFGQNVGINTTGGIPNSSALLDVDASPGNNLGMLIPRVALTQTSSNAPIGAGIALSLLVYNTATSMDVTPGYYYWTGAAWVRFFTSNSGAWQLTGNTGTIASTSAIGVAVNNNFIGTTDAKDFVFATNNLERIRISSAGNIGIGTIAPVAPFQIAGNNPSLMFSPTVSGGGGSYRSFKIQSIPGAGFGYLAISCISDDNVNTYSGLTIGALGDLGVGYPWLNPIPYNLSFYVNAGGQVTKTIGVTTNLGGAGFPGGHLSISAGAPGNGADQTGGNLYLSSGNSRGNQGSQMEFRTTTPGAAGLGINTATTKMIILAAGNVGIGTLLPVQRLDVNGNINIASTMNIRINNVRVLSNQGSFNMFVGDNAGIANLAAGQYNSFFGYEAGSRNTTGMYNTFIGFQAGNASVGSFENVVIGDRAGGWGASLLDFNVLIGAHAGLVSTAAQNTFVGGQAGDATTTGGYNVFIGTMAGHGNTTGTYNTIIGNIANVGATGLTKSGAIGYNAIVNASNAFVIGGTGVDAVNVGIGTTTPNTSSLLDLTSTVKGILVPRMTAAQKTAIPAPATGLLIYQTDVPAGFYYYTGAIWTLLWSGATGTGWSLTGNAGTAPGTNFLGTTDAQALVFRTNNTEWVRVSTTGNVGIGTNAPGWKLHLYGTSNDAADIYCQTDAGRIIKHWFVNAGQSWSIGQFGTTVAPNGQFRITNETTASPRMTFFTAGNILFNSTALVSAFDLVEARGDATFPNAITGLTSIATGFCIQGINSNASGTAVVGAGNGVGVTYLIAGSGGAFSGTLGVLGYSPTATGRGVYGLNNAAAGVAIGFGGVFTSLQTGGSALVGSLGTNFSYYAGTAVSGITVNTLAGGIGGLFGCDNATGIGVQGQSAGATGYGVFGSAFYGVRGQSIVANGRAVYGITNQNTAYGVYGVNIHVIGTGVIGLGNNNPTFYTYPSGSGGAFTGSLVGVLGEGDNNAGSIGVFGESLNDTGIGVLGRNGFATGFGVEGFNTHASGTGIIGIGNNATGSYLASGSGGAFTGSVIGVYGYVPVNADNNWAGYFASAATTVTYIAGRSGGTDYALLSTGTKSTIVKDLNNDPVIMFCPETPEVLFQDYGTGTLVNGKATITLDPIFSNNIYTDKDHPIKVFIQLEGDCQGVYVTNKTINGFDVVELNNGSSNAPFSWTIVANRANSVTDGVVSNYSTIRFPSAPNSIEIKTINANLKHDIKSNIVSEKDKSINSPAVIHTDNSLQNNVSEIPK